jgi:hypothetical protein
MLVIMHLAGAGSIASPKSLLAALHAAALPFFISFACPKETKQRKRHPLRRRFCSFHCKTSRHNLKAVQGFLFKFLSPKDLLAALQAAALDSSHFLVLLKKWRKTRCGCTFVPQNLRQGFGRAV